jgi:hypothetical protein
MSGVWTRTWSSARKTCATCFSAQKQRRNCEHLGPGRGSLRLQSLEWIGDRRRAPASPHACKDAAARLGPCRRSSCLQGSSLGRWLSNSGDGSWYGIWSACLAAIDCDSSNRKCAKVADTTLEGPVAVNRTGTKFRFVILGGCSVLFFRLFTTSFLVEEKSSLTHGTTGALCCMLLCRRRAYVLFNRCNFQQQRLTFISAHA